MTEPIAVVRQTTFNTEPIDSTDSRTRRGNIELPIVDDEIYGEIHGEIKRQDTRPQAAPKPPPSSFGDSDLGILSDVGFIGGSDTDDPPPFKSVLSLSSKKRVPPKQPRIKVPSRKVDSNEPTIPEEKSQDFLALGTPLQSRGNTASRIFQTEKTKTIVVGGGNGQSYELVDTDTEKLGVNNKTLENKLNALKEHEDLDTSMCESDWQPKPKKHNRAPSQTQHSSNAAEADKKVIERASAGLNIGKRWAQNEDGTPKYIGPLKNSTEKDSGSKTPVTLHCLESKETDKAVNSDWNNEHVSGVPKSKNKLFSKAVTPRGQGHTSSILTPRSQGNLSTVATPRSGGVKQNAFSKMDTDDYDYASETFEEVLQERNAMVKSEKTYTRRIKQLEEELKAVLNQSQGLSDENKELRLELDAERSKKSKQGDDTDLKTKTIKLEKENDGLSQANEKLTKRAKDAELKTKQVDGVFVENTKLKNKNAEIDRQFKELQKQVQNEDASTTKNKSVLEAIVADSEKENKALQIKIKLLEGQNRSLSDGLEEKRTEVEELLKAMNNESSTDRELIESKEQLSKTRGELDHVTSEVVGLRKTLHDSERDKDKLQQLLVQKENDVRKSRLDSDLKDRSIVDIRSNLDKVREEAARLQREANGSKGMDVEIQHLKSRIGSLKAEVEGSMQENQKLKKDRDESHKTIEQLRQQNVTHSEAVSESRRYFRKWELEKDIKSKQEVELAKKDENIQILDTRLRDANSKMNALHTRLRGLEDERSKMEGSSYNELQANNKILRDENKKLRAMLVERNIELTNKSSEQKHIDNRIQMLERKQQDADTQVKQLSGWVSSRDAPHNDVDFEGVPRTSRHREPMQSVNQNMQNHLMVPKRNSEPLMDQQWTKKKTRAKPPQGSVTPPPAWQQKKKRGHEEPSHTPLSLPNILDTAPQTPPDPHGGYFRMYQEKVKRMKERKF